MQAQKYALESNKSFCPIAKRRLTMAAQETQDLSAVLSGDDTGEGAGPAADVPVEQETQRIDDVLGSDGGGDDKTVCCWKHVVFSVGVCPLPLATDALFEVMGVVCLAWVGGQTCLALC